MIFSRFGRSLTSALRGLKRVFQTELNFRIQTAVAVIVLFFCWYFPLSSGELIVTILLIGLVLVMELLNTSVEYMNDLLKPRLNFYVYVVKDIMAAAVLLTSIGAVIIGLIIFWPHFIVLLR